MAKKKPPKNAFADPSVLSPRDLEDKELIQVIIETPKGAATNSPSTTQQKVFELKKVLPAGMTFPHDFGFIPSTKAEDGDPADVLVLMDEPAYPGCLIKCRPIGIIEGEQDEKKERRSATTVSWPSKFKITNTLTSNTWTISASASSSSYKTSS